MAVVLHLRVNWRAYGDKQLIIVVYHIRILVSLEQQVFILVAANGLFPRRGLREYVALGQTGRLRFKPRTLAGRAAPVHVEYHLPVAVDAPVASRHPRMR